MIYSLILRLGQYPAKSIVVTGKLRSPLHVFSCLNKATQYLILLKLPSISCIYVFVCFIDGKQYIGSAQDISHRMGEHFNGVKSNVRLQRAIRKHGINNFIFVVYELAPYHKPDILLLEDLYLSLIHPDLLYNFRLSATSMLGYKHTAEAVAKMVARLAEPSDHPFFGKSHIWASRLLISKPGTLNPMFGKSQTKETRATMSAQKSIPV